MKIDRKIAIKILLLTVGVVLAIPVIYNIMIHEYYKEENQESFWAMIIGYVNSNVPSGCRIPSITQHREALSE